MWIETVHTPATLAWANGRLMQPFTPFELKAPVRIGGLGADLIWMEPYELILEPRETGFHLVHRTAETSKSVMTEVGTTRASPPLSLRVMHSPHDSAGWPAEIGRPRAPWTDETLSVLGDQFLERGLTVGQRFISRTEKEDAVWLPALNRPPGPSGAIWRRGVLDALTVQVTASWELGRALALQAICVPLRELRLHCDRPLDPSAVIKGMIEGGGLPCLQTLGIEAMNGRRRGGTMIQRDATWLRELPGFREAFPSLEGLETLVEIPAPPPRPVG